MLRGIAVAAVLLVAAGPVFATYVVKTAADAGDGSLRWAIERANAHAGADTITFDDALSGATIRPLTPLPALTDDGTILIGDLDTDGGPDITIDGHNLTTGHGLRIEADDCTVWGLAIVRCPGSGLRLCGAWSPNVFGCHLGVNRAGDTKQANAGSDVLMLACQEGGIGPGIGMPNLIAGGIAGTSAQGVRIVDCTDVDVVGNYIGLTASGDAAFGGGNIGVSVEGAKGGSARIVIGKGTAGGRNLFAGLREGVRISSGDGHSVKGNWFGLADDGTTLLTLTGPCVRLSGGVQDSDIGGTGTSDWNVFAGDASSGVLIEGATTSGNRVQGNWFGSNAWGTDERPLSVGVSVAAGAGANQIGGGNAAARNHLTSTVGIAFAGGTRSVVRRNRFGILANGSGSDAQVQAITVGAGVDVLIDGNVIVRSSSCGVCVDGAGANPRVFRNTFRNCATAVRISGDARCRLGNLGDASTGDDGGNQFRPSNTWQIRNQTDNAIKAEGNDFGTTVEAKINAKIWDRQDDPALGRVDFAPLMGGVAPTGLAGEGTLALTRLSALPTQAGAQVTFALSCPAEVSARGLCQSRACDAGPNTLLWDARTDAGLAAPAGAYLLEIIARTPDGAQARALTPTRLTR